jgi:hypothetical protein
VNFEELARSTDEFNAAQLRAVAVEAGMIALRDGANEIHHEHFLSGILEVQSKKKNDRRSSSHYLRSIHSPLSHTVTNNDAPFLRSHLAQNFTLLNKPPAFHPKSFILSCACVCKASASRFRFHFLRRNLSLVFLSLVPGPCGEKAAQFIADIIPVDFLWGGAGYMQ